MKHFYKIIWLLAFTFVCLQTAKAEFVMEGTPQPADSWWQGFIGHKFPHGDPTLDPSDPNYYHCADPSYYGMNNGFNSWPLDNSNGLVDEIRFTVVPHPTDGSTQYFKRGPNDLNNPIVALSTGWELDRYDMVDPLQTEGEVRYMVIKNTSSDDVLGNRGFFNFTVHFYREVDNYAFFYFDAYYKGCQKERYACEWVPFAAPGEPLNVGVDEDGPSGPKQPHGQGWTIYRVDPRDEFVIDAGSMVLWLNPAENNGGASHDVLIGKRDGPAYGGELENWYDQAYLADWNDANMTPKPDRRPELKTEVLNLQNGVDFSKNSSIYGQSDVMTIPYNEEITVASNQGVSTSKTLLVVFKFKQDGWNNSYWDVSGERQVLCEFGGPLSGFNIYTLNNSIGFGMWNRNERVFSVKTMAFDPTKIYMAILEWDEFTQQFRGTITDNSGAFYPSDVKDFSGIIYDNFSGYDDASAVGGASRTCFHDYNVGSMYSHEFNGIMGDVMLFNNINYPGLSGFDLGAYIGALNAKYVTFFRYDEFPNHTFLKPQKSEGWVYYEQKTKSESDLGSLGSYPNPFDTKTTFSVDIPEAQSTTVALFDAQGNKIKTIFAGSLSAGIHDFTIDGNGLNNGLYIFRVTGQNFVQSGKVILNK